MDVIIPSHNLKVLSSAVSTLGKIGKVLYIEFDPLDGLTLRALNDAKSSFCCFHFDVGFFERCAASSATTMATPTTASRGLNQSSNNHSSGNARTPIGGRRSRNSTSRRRRKRGRSTSNAPSTATSTRKNDSNDDDMFDNDEKYVSKVPIKTIATVLRSRKGVTSLRIRSTTSIPIPASDSNATPNQLGEESDHDELGAQMQLSFEYSIQTNGIMRVVHKVNVSNAEGIIAIANKYSCSEIVTLPKILLTMFDQVKSTTEVALTVHNDECKKVVASSFHHGDNNSSSHNNNGENKNMIINANYAARLKTETSIDCHEFEEFHFMDDVAIENVLEKENEGNDQTMSNNTSSTPPPDNVSEEVTLVFSVKEAKAMLQFCVSSQSNYLDDEDARVIVSFYWGGRPLTLETEGESFHGELILATLDHHVLLNGA